MVRVPPTRSNSCSCRTRSNLACASSGSSPTSSRNIVPLSASSKRPLRCSVAPVNAPFSWPNSSLSTNSRGSAAQFTLTSGWVLRLLRLWMARTNNSLPVPVSPWINTVLSVSATCSSCPRACSSRSDSPMISSKLCRDLISSTRYSIVALERPWASISSRSLMFCCLSFSSARLRSVILVTIVALPPSGVGAVRNCRVRPSNMVRSQLSALVPRYISSADSIEPCMSPFPKSPRWNWNSASSRRFAPILSRSSG